MRTRAVELPFKPGVLSVLITGDLMSVWVGCLVLLLVHRGIRIQFSDADQDYYRHPSPPKTRPATLIDFLVAISKCAVLAASIQRSAATSAPAPHDGL